MIDPLLGAGETVTVDFDFQPRHLDRQRTRSCQFNRGPRTNRRTESSKASKVMGSRIINLNDSLRLQFGALLWAEAQHLLQGVLGVLTQGR